jgi:hypothetical protein
MIKDCPQTVFDQSLSFAQSLRPEKNISYIKGVAQAILLNPHDRPSAAKPVFKAGFALNYTHSITIETDGRVFHSLPCVICASHNELLNLDIRRGRSQIFGYMIRKFPLRTIQEEEIVYQNHAVMDRSIINSVTGESASVKLYRVNYLYKQVPVTVEMVIGEGIWIEGFTDFDYLHENVVSNIVAQAMAEGVKDLEIISLRGHHWHALADGQEKKYLVK